MAFHATLQTPDPLVATGSLPFNETMKLSKSLFLCVCLLTFFFQGSSQKTDCLVELKAFKPGLWIDPQTGVVHLPGTMLFWRQENNALIASS